MHEYGFLQVQKYSSILEEQCRLNSFLVPFGPKIRSSIRSISIVDMSIREISDTNLYQNGNGNNKSTECLTCLAAGDSVCDIVYCTSSETRFLSLSPRVISRTMVAIIFVAGMIVLIAVVWMLFQMDMEQCQVKKFLAASALYEAFSRQVMF